MPKTYVAVFQPTQNGYSVYFPDLPGCASYGNTIQEAKQNAIEALELHLSGMKKDGDEIPLSSQNPEIDPETVPGYFIYPVLGSREIKNENFYDKDGNFFLVQCPKCKKENYITNVKTGICAWCGYDGNKEENKNGENGNKSPKRVGPL